MTLQRLVLVCGLLLGACGGDHGAHDPDMQTPADLYTPTCGSGHDMLTPGVGQACVTDQDCPQPTGGSSTAGEYLICDYPIADGCSAKGQCRLVQMPTCATVTLTCGCNGQPVPNSSCYYGPGFAGGPVMPGTTWPQDCPGDGGQ